MNTKGKLYMIPQTLGDTSSFGPPIADGAKNDFCIGLFYC